MQDKVDTITIPIAYIEVFTLMLVSFIIGYTFAYYYHRSKYIKKVAALQRNLSTPSKTIRTSTQISSRKEREPLVETEDNDFDLNLHKKAFSQQVLEKPTDNDGLYLDFDRLGYAAEENADNLQKIVGIGPYTEEKLNDIGIFTYSQVSKFNDKDIEIVTELIKFFPDRIKNDQWVAKAKHLQQQKKSGLADDSFKASMRRA